MSNIHGLSSFRNNNSDDDNNSDENNNRYVGGVSSRGGGSGLAVEPNNADGNNDDILGTIRSNAEVAQPPSASGADSASGSNTRRRMITMYRSGFTIDDQPFRRLDDPLNADFLRDLARGVTPRELYATGEDGSGATSGDMEVGLVDKRHMEYEDDPSRNGGSSASATPSASTAFSGAGQSLGGAGSSEATSSDGVITPSSMTDAQKPTVDESKPTTTIQIRLLNGKRLIVKCNLDDTVQILVVHIQADADAASASGGDNYVLSSGYPPRVLSDLNKTIEECGLKGAQVMQKKA